MPFARLEVPRAAISGAARTGVQMRDVFELDSGEQPPCCPTGAPIDIKARRKTSKWPSTRQYASSALIARSAVPRESSKVRLAAAFAL